jgi:hypothetical protein
VSMVMPILCFFIHTVLGGPKCGNDWGVKWGGAWRGAIESFNSDRDSASISFVYKAGILTFLADSHIG